MDEKRFTIEGIDEEICQIYDNGNCMGTDEVCDLLNALHEENQSLKKEIARMKWDNISYEPVDEAIYEWKCYE